MIVSPPWFVAAVAVMVFALPQGQAQLVLIEENFDEAVSGGRMTAGGEDGDQTGIHPSEGLFGAFMNDEGEIVPGWEGKGNAFQFQDKIKNAALRLAFGTRDVDPITSGKLEVSLDFRIDGQGVPPYGGHPLELALTAPTQPYFLMVIIHRENGRIAYTNRATLPAYESMSSSDEALVPGTVYRLTMTASLQESIYDLALIEMESGDVVWQASDQMFVPIPELETNGLGATLLNIQAGSADFSQGLEAPVTVTVDNILVRHLE